MKPWLHAVASAKKYGGEPSDYLMLHLFFDKTKEHVPDNRHRVVLHNSFGIFLLSQMFGETRINLEIFASYEEAEHFITTVDRKRWQGWFSGLQNISTITLSIEE